MYIYDIVALVFVGISHVIFYIQLIRYTRLSTVLVMALSIVFTILLGIVVTVTGYPELNAIMLLFLMCIGLMKEKLSFTENFYFALVSTVVITLVKLVLIEAGMALFMLSPLNLYLWTGSVIHLIVMSIILASIMLFRKSIRRIAGAIVGSPLYYISYGLLIVGFIVVIILTSPSTALLASLHQQYGEASYIAAFILFFLLLLIILFAWHLSKAKMAEEHEKKLEKARLDYVEKLEQLHDELASFRHDYMNILLSLDEAIRTKNMQQIERVYQDVIAPTSKVINDQEIEIVKLARIQVPEVKSVLTVKVLAAQQQQLNVMLDIPETIESIAMPTTDFIRVVSILIDNAIEEAVQSTERMLHFAMFEINLNQYVVIRNSCKHETIDLEKIYEKSYSSKQENEGYGLFSLKRIIDKTTNATLETTFTAPYFTQTLVLKKS